MTEEEGKKELEENKEDLNNEPQGQPPVEGSPDPEPDPTGQEPGQEGQPPGDAETPPEEKPEETAQPAAPATLEPIPWQSHYLETRAQRKIRNEAIYLVVLLFLYPTLMYLVWTLGKNSSNDSFYLHSTVCLNAYAWLGGSLGGVLFSLKWLVFGVAKKVWLEDKQWWRYLTPHLSGGMAFFFILLMRSEMIKIFAENALEDPSGVVGLSCLIGYFSDKAAGKLAELAKTLFGETRETEFGKKKGNENGQDQPATRPKPGGRKPDGPAPNGRKPGENAEGGG